MHYFPSDAVQSDVMKNARRRHRRGKRKLRAKFYDFWCFPLAWMTLFMSTNKPQWIDDETVEMPFVSIGFKPSFTNVFQRAMLRCESSSLDSKLIDPRFYSWSLIGNDFALSKRGNTSVAFGEHIDLSDSSRWRSQRRYIYRINMWFSVLIMFFSTWLWERAV